MIVAAASGDTSPAEITTVAGVPYFLPGPDAATAVVLLFVGHDCPISNWYAKEIGRLCENYTAKSLFAKLV